MKFKFAVTALILLNVTTAFSQNAFYDALFLKDKLNPKNMTGNIALNNTVRNKLETYYGPLPVFADQSSIDAFFVPNPFFRNSANPAISIFSFAAAMGLPPVSNLLTSAGNLDITNLADGFAKFLVERTKEELNVAFFEKFKEKLDEPAYADAVTLFPQTAITLRAIGDQIYNYEMYINALREAFETDINSLLSNMPKVINSPRYNKANPANPNLYFDNHPQLKSVCLSAAYIGDGLLNKTEPGQIIRDFDVTDLNGFATPAGNNDVKAAMQTLQLFSESLRSKGTDHYWIDKDSLNILLNDPVALQIYFGLLYQKAGVMGISFNTGTLQSVLSGNLLPIANITNANNYIKGFISRTFVLTQKIKNIVGIEKDKLSFQDYYELYSSALDVIDYASDINTFPGLGALIVGNNFKNFMQIARAAGNIALAVNRKNYSSAIINAYQVYNYAFTATPDDNTNNRVKMFLLRYGSFAASVAQAQNSDDVKNAIEAAALPSGSSRVKRETPFNVSLNAYTGLFTGREKIKGVEDDKLLNTYGVTAPVGIAISRGHSFFFMGTGKNGWKKNKYGWSSSLFISLVDIGTIAAFRFKDDKAEQVPTIQLKQIISPGAFISTGIPKTPLSVNLGAQVGPSLRKIYNGGQTVDVSDKTYVRYSISLCVDIPLLNFYTGSR